MSKTRESLFGLPLDIGLEPAEVVARIDAGPLLLSYLNPFAWEIARRDRTYIENLQQFDLVVCDGIGVQCAARSVFKVDTSIISMDFSGIARDYLELWSRRQWSLCLVGGSDAVVHAAADRIRHEYPGARLDATFKGYGEGPEKATEHIADQRIDLVLVGMGMGLQESFLVGLRTADWRGSGICVGGFFEKLADPGKEYPAWSERYKVRFLGRLSREPRRLLRRYTLGYLSFMKRYLRHFMGQSNS